ncbi:alpha/beta fold hydrolase [Streptomyces sp. NPDC058614]|uniref:alpha/beta fold hydrolase n=1 Tax=Streptomyces sp. NPDC058614 TaxID=3346557 RepID=UPI00364B05B8
MDEPTSAPSAGTNKYESAPNLRTTAADGVEYAYRDVGPRDGRALVLLQHFRGNLDSWDPALIDALAQHRRVITMDYQGVGGSSGTPADTIEQMAREVLAFTVALGIETFDLLGFSIGSFVAQRVALARPDAVDKVVLASTAPQGARGMHGWAPEVIGAVGRPQTSAAEYMSVFFTASEAGRAAGGNTLTRIYSRTDGRDVETDWATRMGQYDAVTKWGVPNTTLFEELEGLTAPVFVANGDSDPMILPKYSYLIAGLLPNATVKIYEDAAHGFLFQYYEEFASDVITFLDGE